MWYLVCILFHPTFLSLPYITMYDIIIVALPTYLCIHILVKLQLHFVHNIDKRQEPSSHPAPSLSHSSLVLTSLSTNTPRPKDSSDHRDYCRAHSTDNILFFIRLPKCASTSFVDLLQKLSTLTNFYMEFNPSGAYNWNQNEKITVARQCSRKLFLKKKLVYARHFYFVNFTTFGLRNFTYVTIVRDPIDRVVSSYLYYHFSSKKHIQYILKTEHKNESLITCLHHQHEGCTHNLATKYFCGHENWCKFGDKRALETAKRNLKRHFAVVGIMEEIELSVHVLRHLLPQFFVAGSERDAGALTLPALNRNERRVSVTEEERLEIARANAADIELYDYAVQLLHNQASQCGLVHDINL